ncbi:hypothetical protein VTK56DRAFT_333 [Thermocarpiscus australiensis]
MQVLAKAPEYASPQKLCMLQRQSVGTSPLRELISRHENSHVFISDSISAATAVFLQWAAKVVWPSCRRSARLLLYTSTYTARLCRNITIHESPPDPKLDSSLTLDSKATVPKVSSSYHRKEHVDKNITTTCIVSNLELGSMSEPVLQISPGRMQTRAWEDNSVEV